MSVGAPIQVSPDRRYYVAYVGEDAPVELYGTKSEVQKEAQRRVEALRGANSNSLRTKLRNIPIRRKGSVATTPTEEDPVSSINLLDLPNEILDVILSEVGVKNFYEDPSRLAVCKKWHHLVRGMMDRRVELDVNSLLRVVSLARTSRFSKMLRRSSKDNDKIGLRLGEIQHFDADLRIINGFTMKNNVPIERNGNYRQWKKDVDLSLSWLATHIHELTTVRSLHLRAWSAYCPIAEASGKQWRRLARDVVSNLLHTPSVLDRVELDFCGTEFTLVRCGRKDDSSCCLGISNLLPRVRVLRLRLQSMCPTALQIPSDVSDMRLEELIVNRDTSEAHPWSQSGPHAGICMRVDALAGPDNQEMVRAMRDLIPHMRAPHRVRFVWMDNAFETVYDPDVRLPLNKDGKIAYRGSVAYDLLTESVQRLGFLAPWDSTGTPIPGCYGHLWEKNANENTNTVSHQQISLSETNEASADQQAEDNSG